MSRRPARMLAISVGGVLFWSVVSRVTGAAEPWDADAYWCVWYPVSLLLAAMAGTLLGRAGWIAGALLTFAQLPVMWFANQAESLYAAGLFISCVLAIPATALSALTGWFAARRRPV